VSAVPPYDGVLFDLFSALLDSQPAYDAVAGSASLGSRWRTEHSRLAYSAGEYRPQDDLVAEAAERAGLTRDLAPALLARLGELSPFATVRVRARTAEPSVSSCLVTSMA
jgi:2-haloacid dehalogenase